jgi:hypothetical protein
MLSNSIAERLKHIESATSARYVGSDESATLASLSGEIDGLDSRALAVEELWSGLIVHVRQELKQLVQDLDTLDAKLSELNRLLRSITISNLDRVQLDLKKEIKIVDTLKKIAESTDMPLFVDKSTTRLALKHIGELLETRPRLHLLDLFSINFSVTGADGVEKRYEHLDQIESVGTAITIKVLVNIMLLRSLLADREVHIPFYLDEVGSLDEANLSAILELARQNGFVAVLASPLPRDVADMMYHLVDHKGRVTLEARESRTRIDHGRGD